MQAEVDAHWAVVPDIAVEQITIPARRGWFHRVLLSVLGKNPVDGEKVAMTLPRNLVNGLPLGMSPNRFKYPLSGVACGVTGQVVSRQDWSRLRRGDLVLVQMKGGWDGDKRREVGDRIELRKLTSRPRVSVGYLPRADHWGAGVRSLSKKEIQFFLAGVASPVGISRGAPWRTPEAPV